MKLFEIVGRVLGMDQHWNSERFIDIDICFIEWFAGVAALEAIGHNDQKGQLSHGSH